MSLTSVESLVVILLVGLTVAGWSLSGVFIRRLAAHHASVWKQLGSPTLLWNASPKTQFAFSKFLWSARYRELDDRHLNRLGDTLRAGMILIAVGYLAALLATLIP
jgi:hypothetical protein